MMRHIGSPTVHLATEPVDMRKSINGLSLEYHQLKKRYWGQVSVRQGLMGLYGGNVSDEVWKSI